MSNPDGELKNYDVCGNICETGDCFAEQRELPNTKVTNLLLKMQGLTVIRWGVSII